MDLSFKGKGFFFFADPEKSNILDRKRKNKQNQQKRLRSKVFECGCVGVTCFYVSVSETERRKCYMGEKKKDGENRN